MPTHKIISKMVTTVIFLTTGLLLTATQSARAQHPVMPPGSGTEEDPYLISELGHLVWMGDTVADSTGVYYTMTADIDATATATWNDFATGTTLLEGFMPIGKFTHTYAELFRGIFDGDGYTITGLTINRPTSSYAGLFGAIGEGSLVQNVSIIDGSINAYLSVSSLAGMNNQGTVLNCNATCVVTGSNIVGGLIGKCDNGTVSNCYATGAVTGNYQVGGLIGVSAGTISNCYATGPVDGQVRIGGLIGIGHNTISNCYATGAVTGQKEVGGLVGNNWSTISNCYAVGPVTGDQLVGGLVGIEWNNWVTRSYWDVDTSGQSTSPSGEGMTTAEMMLPETFIDWDFKTIWDIDENETYPYLRSSTDGEDEDTDGDGIPDAEDKCPESDTYETIVINGYDTGVVNLSSDAGCTLADEIVSLAETSASHGEFVEQVTHLTNEWKRDGLITGAEKGRIQSVTARSATR